MIKIVKLIADTFGFFFGANGFWKDMLFGKLDQEDEPLENRRLQVMFIVRPIITSLWLVVFWMSIAKGPNIIIDSLTRRGYTNGVGGGVISFFQHCLMCAGKIRCGATLIDEMMRNTLSPIAAFFPYNLLFRLSAMGIYIVWYRIFRKRRNKTLLMAGKRLIDAFPEINHILADIYVEDSVTHSLQLMPKWKRVREGLGIIIFLNFIIFYFFNVISGFATVLIWNALPENLVIFTGFFCMMEAYRFLSFADMESNKRKEVPVLNLLKLRTDHSRYADRYNVCMTSVYKNNLNMVREKIRIVEETYKESERPEVAFMYYYLQEHQQLEHIEMTVRLNRGENIFYASPFYRDIDACIFFTMFQALLRHEKALILTENDENIGNIGEWLDKGLESVTGIRGLWNVAVMRGSVADVDVGVLSFQKCAEYNMNGLEEFLREVSFAVVLEAANLLVGGQETVITMAEHIHSEQHKCTWLLCDWNAESMIDLFSHLLGVEFAYVSATPVGAGEVAVSYWDVESEPNSVWEPAKRFLGLEVGIAEVAGINHISHMVWYGEEWMPVVDMNWLIGQYYRVYSNRISRLVSQSGMNTRIQCYVSAISCGVEQESFLVVEDSCCNLYEAGRQFASRGRDRVYVHVLSINYLLRNFMKSRSEVMQSDPKYIAQFVPEYVNSIRNVSLHLLRRLLEGEVSDRDIYDSLKSCENSPEYLPGKYADFRVRETIGNMVWVMLDIRLQIETDIWTLPRRVFSEEEECMVQELNCRVLNGAVRNKFRKYFKQAMYMDETGKKRHIGQLMLAGHLELKYLPGQNAILDGKYYQVEQILDSGEEVLLIVKRASEQVEERCYYRQLREYWLQSDPKQANETSERALLGDTIKLVTMSMNFVALTNGYLAVPKRWNNFDNTRYIELEHSYQRRYIGKQVLRVDLSTDCVEKCDILYLAAVIREMFYTLYPKYCYLLSVAVPWEEYGEIDRSRYRGILSEIKGENISENETERYSFYIIEDSSEDMGLLRSIENHFSRILQIAAEYIHWENGKQSFFGFENINYEKLNTLLSTFLVQNSANEAHTFVQQIQGIAKKCCAYCGRTEEQVSIEKGSFGENICADCMRELVRQKEVCSRIVKETIYNTEYMFTVSWGKWVKVKRWKKIKRFVNKFKRIRKIGGKLLEKCRNRLRTWGCPVWNVCILSGVIKTKVYEKKGKYIFKIRRDVPQGIIVAGVTYSFIQNNLLQVKELTEDWREGLLAWYMLSYLYNMDLNRYANHYRSTMEEWLSPNGARQYRELENLQAVDEGKIVSLEWGVRHALDRINGAWSG